MSFRRWTLVVVWLAVAGLVGAGQDRPDFTGTWIVDRVDMPDPPAGGPDGGPGGGWGRGPGGRGGGYGGMRGSGGEDRPDEVRRAPRMRLSVGQKVTIRQTADRLILTVPGEDGDQMMAFTLDGRESTNVMGPSTLKSKTKWEGVALVTESTEKLEGPRGAMTLKAREVRTLIDAGETMVVTRTMRSPRGDLTSTVEYRRASVDEPR